MSRSVCGDHYRKGAMNTSTYELQVLSGYTTIVYDLPPCAREDHDHKGAAALAPFVLAPAHREELRFVVASWTKWQRSLYELILRYVLAPPPLPYLT